MLQGGMMNFFEFIVKQVEDPDPVLKERICGAGHC